VRLLDAMILIYFGKVGLLEALLQRPDLAITTSVRREVRSSPTKEIVEAALANGALALCDIDPGTTVEPTLYVMYRDGDGLGEGEATCMALAHARGFTFVSHDGRARGKAAAAGIKLLDWPDLLAELNDSGVVSSQQCRQGERAIRRLLKE
jgi:predicted nucleic acid-binding protein